MAAAGLLILLAACGGGDQEDEGVGSAAEERTPSGECDQVDELAMGFPGIPPDFVQMGVPLAEDLGYLAYNCLAVEYGEVEPGIAGFRAMQAGEFQLAYSGSVSPILAKGQGADAIVWGSPAALLDFQVVALPKIKSCDDIEGQKVATDGRGGLIHAIFEQYLSECGLDIDKDVNILIGDPETFQVQLSKGVIRATALHLDERIFVEKEIKVELNELANSWEYAPDFHYASLSSPASVVEERRDEFVRFHAAVLRANRWISDPANREDAIAAIAKVSEQSEATVEEAYDLFVDNFPTTCEEALPPEAFEFLIDLQVDLGNLQQPFEVDELVDSSICQEAEALLEDQGF